MLDYDKEADRYDATRGGTVRAEAAAAAVDTLLEPDLRQVLDVGAGTGSVSAALAAYGRTVYGTDASPGMLGQAATRLPGRRVCADAGRLPLRDGVFDAVYAMWLLHLVPDPEAVVAECLRVLRPGGRFVTTVELAAAHRRVACDVNETLDRYSAAGWQWQEHDEPDRVRIAVAAAGGHPAGEATYLGHGRGTSPAQTVREIATGGLDGALDDSVRERAVAELRALPDQRVHRPDPTYTLLAFTRRG